MGRTLCVIALMVMALVVWKRHHHHGTVVQAAVIPGGFAIAHDHRMLELDAQGAVRRELALDQADDVRVVGTRGGPAAVWLAGRKIHFALVDDGAESQTFGKSARQLCDGVASNDARFGVAWLESDGRVWMVHGPMGAHVADEVEAIARREAAGTPSWCGIAAADDQIALVWRERDRLYIDMCSAKRCNAMPYVVGLDANLPLLGVGCVHEACLVAARDESGTARIALVARNKARWTKPLATTAGTASVIGAGDRAFAVAIAADHGAEVIRFDRDGNAASVWRDATATSVPALAWSGGRLLVAYQRGGELVHDAVAMPR
jgi:hypothetical protein